MSKPKVLYLTNNLMSYRVPILNILAQRYDVSVAFSEGTVPDEEINFEIIKLKNAKKIGPILWHSDNISKLCDKFNVVISVSHIYRIKYIWQEFRMFKKFKFIIWTIGVSASREHHYDENKRFDWLRDFFYKKADACVFYTDYPVKKNLNRGYNPDAMFVAHNTVVVSPSNEVKEKNSLLFLGSLYKAKGIGTLLEEYKKAYHISPDIPVLNIVGGGSEYDEIRDWIKINQLSSKIRLIGPVYDSERKRDFYEHAYICISPCQAGLSVPESLGYGVPFITTRNAITGGEIFNIIHGETGLLMENTHELSSIILDVAKNPKKYIEMGVNARNYYNNNCNPGKMVQGLAEAIEYCLKQQ